MRVHPTPRKRNNITIREESVKKLRRLPHIFTRVLELPFGSDADVTVEEKPDCFKFVAETEIGYTGGELRAHTVEIYPGVTKIVVRTNGSLMGLSSLDELELDVWRFRLPETTLPELVTAVYADGELVVTVPKTDHRVEDGGDADFRLVLIQ